MSKPLPDRPFTLPWTRCENDDACWLQTADGMCFAYTYFRDQPLIGTGDEYPTRSQARRITAAIARLPKLTGRA